MVSKSSMPGPSAIFGCDGGKFGRCRRPGFAFHPGNTEQNILWKYILPQEWRAATYSYETLPLRWTRARSDSSTRLLCSWTHMPLQPSSGWILTGEKNPRSNRVCWPGSWKNDGHLHLTALGWKLLENVYDMVRSFAGWLRSHLGS
jgi:hypothetical protein